MNIRRKVFSKVDEKFFSVKDTELIEQKEFAEDDHKVKLKDIKSHRGMGRSAYIGAVGVNPIGGLAGGYAGKKAANKADKEGKSDYQILRAAKKRGANIGTLVGGTTGAVIGARVGGPVGEVFLECLGQLVVELEEKQELVKILKFD